MVDRRAMFLDCQNHLQLAPGGGREPDFNMCFLQNLDAVQKILLSLFIVRDCQRQHPITALPHISGPAVLANQRQQLHAVFRFSQVRKGRARRCRHIA